MVTNNPVVPILENFLFEIEAGKLTITASDLETSMITELPVEARDTGRIAAPARILLDTLKNLPDQPVTFTLDEETYTIEISSANGRYKLAGENAADFPRVPVVKGSSPIEMPSSSLARAINKTIFAVSTDELRPAMTGILVQLADSQVTFVATDGHRLLRYRRQDVGAGQTANLIIPRKAFNLLKGTLPSEATPVKIEFNQSNAFFSFNQMRLVCKGSQMRPQRNAAAQRQHFHIRHKAREFANLFADLIGQLPRWAQHQALQLQEACVYGAQQS